MERKRDTLYKEIFLQKGVIVKEDSFSFVQNKISHG